MCCPFQLNPPYFEDELSSTVAAEEMKKTVMRPSLQGLMNSDEIFLFGVGGVVQRLLGGAEIRNCVQSFTFKGSYINGRGSRINDRGSR